MNAAPRPPRQAVAQVERGLRRTVAVGQLVGSGIAVFKVAGGGASGYPAWFMWTVVLLLVSTTFCYYALPSHSRDTALRIYVVICVTAMVSQIWAWDPSTTAFSEPPLDNALGIGMGLAALAFRWQIATTIVVIFAGSYLVILPQTTSWLGAIGTASVSSLAGAACVAARNVIDDALTGLARVEGQLEATIDLREELHRRSLSLVKWRDVLHGKVIGSLLAAQRALPAGGLELVRELARDALAAITGIAPTRTSFRESVQQLASANQLDVTCEVEGDWTAGAAAGAFRSALAEALANVSRHSGRREASVSARFAAERWEVSISDRGVGFDPAAVDKARGLQVSLINPIATIGGSHSIQSTIGVGTIVTLTREPLSRLAAPRTPPGTRWLVIIAFGSFLVHFFIAWELRELSRSPVLLLVCAVAMMVLLGLAVRGTQPAALGLAMLAVQLTLAANLHVPVTDLWAFWFAGALCGFSGALAYNGNVAWSASVVALSWLGVAATIALRSGELLGRLTFELAGFYAAPLAASVFGIIGWIISLSRRAQQAQAAERDVALIQAGEVDRSTRQWLETHSALIDRVTPTLRRLTEAELASNDLLDDCRILEAECRDHLEVPALVTPPIARALERARRRGVTTRFSAQPETSENSLQLQKTLLTLALSIESLRSIALTSAADGISLLIRADRTDIPLDHLGTVGRLTDVVELDDGILARFESPTDVNGAGKFSHDEPSTTESA